MAGQDIRQGYRPIRLPRHTRVSSRCGVNPGGTIALYVETCGGLHGGSRSCLPGLVPVDFQAAVTCTSPVDGYGVQLAEGLD